jgi:superfamily II DNA or RNA helicase
MLSALTGSPVIRRHKPHPYQTEAIEKTQEAWKENDRVLGCCATGGGKTYIAGELIARNWERGGRTLMLAHTRELVFQFARATEANFGIWSTVEAGGTRADESPLVCSTVQSCINRLRKGILKAEDYSLIVWDESHHVMSQTHLEIAKYFPHAKHFGITATPVRTDLKDLLQFFDCKAFDIPMTQLIGDGYLSRLVIKNIPIHIRLERTKNSGDISEEDVAHAIEPYLESCADALVEHGKGRCSLVFTPLISTSIKFCGMLKERGMKAEHVSGQTDTDEQKAIKRRFEMGETEVVTNSMIWSEGLDIRPINLLMSLRPTSSWSLYTQCVGRCTRTFDPVKDGLPGTRWPLKTESIILDPLWLYDQHIQRPETLFAANEEEAKEIGKKLKEKKGGGDLLAAFGDMMHEREEALKKRLEAMSQRKSREIDALELSVALHIPELAEYEPLSRWEKEAMTQGQREFLLKNKIDLSTVKDRGHASKICDALIARVKSGMGTIAQAHYATSLGHPDAYNRSFEDLGIFITQAKAGKNVWEGIPDL